MNRGQNSRSIIPVVLCALQVACASEASSIRTQDPTDLLSGPYFEVEPADIQLVGMCSLDQTRFPSLGRVKEITVFRVRPTWSRASSPEPDEMTVAFLDHAGASLASISSTYTAGFSATRLLNQASPPLTVTTADPSTCIEDQQECEQGAMDIGFRDIRDAAVDCTIEFDHVLVGISTDSFGIVDSTVSNDRTTCSIFGAPRIDAVNQLMLSPPARICIERSAFVDQLLKGDDAPETQ